MTNVTLTTEQAQQIEEALEDIVRVFKFETGTPVEALAVIHAARAQEQAEQEPVATVVQSRPDTAVIDVHTGNAPLQLGALLYAAPVEPVKQEQSIKDAFAASVKPIAEQEPVATVVSEHTHGEYESIKKLVDYRLPCRTKLYAAPVRIKDLTDDEILVIANMWEDEVDELDFARAVIAADRELNR